MIGFVTLLFDGFDALLSGNSKLCCVCFGLRVVCLAGLRLIYCVWGGVLW